MAGMVVSNRVLLQDESGRFMADVDGKAHEAIWEVTLFMARQAVGFAPKRSGALARSIEGYMTGPMEGTVVATAPHALPQETGGAPHPIATDKGAMANQETGFFAAAPPGFGGHFTVQHPGNPATHFMAKAFAKTRAVAPKLFAKHFGG